MEEIFIPASDFTKKMLQKLTIIEKKLPGKSMFGQKVRRAFKLKNKCIQIPRNMIHKLFPSIGIKVDVGTIRTLSDSIFESTSSALYEYQELIISHLLLTRFSPVRIQKGLATAYLQLDTGLGKTRIGCHLISQLKMPSLIVVPTEAIAIQWIEEIEELFPDVSAKLYKNSLPMPPTPDRCDVTIIIVNTFRSKSKEFMMGYGVCILDEAHELHTEKNSEALWLAQYAPVVLGLSATPIERPDGLDRYVPFHLDDPIVSSSIPGFTSSVVEFRGEVKTILYDGNPIYCETHISQSGTVSAVKTISQLVRDPYRLRLISAEVSRLKDQGVFVFAEHRDTLSLIHEELLKSFSEDEIICPEISILKGGISKQDILKAYSAGAHIVLTTYGYSRRGISIPEITSMILASPRRNGMRQIVGRILRRGSNEKTVRQIVDIVDVSSGLKSQYSDRLKVYKEKKFYIHTSAESYTEHVEEK